MIFLLLGIDVVSQESKYLNNIEFSLFDATKNFDSRSSNTFYFIGYSVRFKRVFYSDKVNNLAFGFSIQNSNSGFNWGGVYDEAGGISYYNRSKIFSPGISLSDHFFLRKRKIGFSLGIEISAKYHITLDQKSSLTYFPYWIDLADPFGNKNSELLNDVSVNKLGIYSALQPSIEFYLFKNLIIYIGYSGGININSHFKSTLVTPKLPKVENFHFYYGLFSIGSKF